MNFSLDASYTSWSHFFTFPLGYRGWVISEQRSALIKDSPISFGHEEVGFNISV